MFSKQGLTNIVEMYISATIKVGFVFTRSLVLCVSFVDRYLSFCPFSFGHCVVCSCSIHGFWSSLWYLQTLLKNKSIPLSPWNHHTYRQSFIYWYVSLFGIVQVTKWNSPISTDWWCWYLPINVIWTCRSCILRKRKKDNLHIK